MSTIGVRLRELRGSSSQKEMADAVGVKQQNWARWESGAVTPSADMLATICSIHDCSSDWLLGIKKRCDGRNVSSRVSAGAGGVAIGGVGNRVSGVVVAGESPVCSKCPYKKKLKALEKLMQK